MVDTDASQEMEWVVQAISTIRALRAELNVPPAARVPLLIKDAERIAVQRIERHRASILSALPGSAKFAVVESAPPGGVQAVVDGMTLILGLGEVVDLPKEKERLGKEIGKLDAELAKIAAKLANASFLAKAKPEVVEEQRGRQMETTRDRDRLRAAFERLTVG